jgi:hypothetical protein
MNIDYKDWDDNEECRWHPKEVQSEIMTKLNRVFGINIIDEEMKTVQFQDGSDGAFEEDITKDELAFLIRDLQELHGMMK